MPGKFEKEYQTEIAYLQQSLDQSGNNSKPVFQHSIIVAKHLHDLGYQKEIVIAAILHDVLEDTSITEEELRERYGSEVTHLVQALTMDLEVSNKTDRYQENFQRCKGLGFPALIIRAADLLDNVDYYHLAATVDLEKWLYSKLRYFLQVNREELAHTSTFQALEKKYKDKGIK